MAIVGRAKYAYTRVRNFEETRREGCVYLAHPTIAIAKIRDHLQSTRPIEQKERLLVF